MKLFKSFCLVNLLLILSFSYGQEKDMFKKRVRNLLSKSKELDNENPFKSLIYLDSATNQALDYGLDSLLCEVYIEKSAINKFLGRNHHYKLNQYKGLEYAERIENDSLIQDFKLGIASTAYLSEDYELGFALIDELIATAEYDENYEFLARVYNIQGWLYSHNKQEEEALESYLKATEYFKKVNDTFRVNKMRSNLGIAYFNLGLHQKSLEYLHQILSTDKLNGDSASFYRDYNNLAEYHYRTNNLDSCYLYTSLSLKYADKYNFKNASLDISELRYLLFEKQGKLDSAYYELKKHKLLSDSILKARSDLAINELEVLFETRQKDKRVHLVEGLIGDVKRKNTSLTTLLLICGSFFLLIVIIVYLAYRQQTSYNRVLVSQRSAIIEKNELIDETLKEKEILLKEIHHRVKNNLQIISSLLNLQSRTITDEKALRALSEGINRIQAIALLHQKLYQNETFSSVNAEDYIEDLTNNLLNTMVGNEKDLKLKLSCNDVVLNLDTAVPLGLIISELVTNSIKHGFKSKDRGYIIMDLTRVMSDRYVFEYADNGAGLPASFKIPMEGSLGTEIIDALTDQLEGELTFKRNNPGAYFQLIFTEVK